MQVVLVMFRADGARRSFTLNRDITVIGRREDCDLRIPLTEISRKHCRVIRDERGLRVEDLGSSNGTYHNGGRVQEAEVQAGDHLQIGPVVFTVQIDGVPADDAIQPPSHDAESSSAGAQLEDSGVAEAAATEAPAESPEPESVRAGGSRAERPAAPSGDDFDVAADDEAAQEADDDIIDLGVSPTDDKDTK